MIPKDKAGAVLRAVREHRQQSQDDVAADAGTDRARVAQIELGSNQATSARTRREIAAGWRCELHVVDSLYEGAMDEAGAALAFDVPVALVSEAVERGVQKGRRWWTEAP